MATSIRASYQSNVDDRRASVLASKESSIEAKSTVNPLKSARDSHFEATKKLDEKMYKIDLARIDKSRRSVP